MYKVKHQKGKKEIRAGKRSEKIKASKHPIGSSTLSTSGLSSYLESKARTHWESVSLKMNLEAPLPIIDHAEH